MLTLRLGPWPSLRCQRRLCGSRLPPLHARTGTWPPPAPTACAHRHMAKQGVRKTERFLPLGSIITVVGELDRTAIASNDDGAGGVTHSAGAAHAGGSGGGGAGSGG
eukprot:360020-Chlamydomonas_euryale.AAC.9